MLVVFLSNIGSDPVVDLLTLSDVQAFAVHDSFAVVEQRELTNVTHVVNSGRYTNMIRLTGLRLFRRRGATTGVANTTPERSLNDVRRGS